MLDKIMKLFSSPHFTIFSHPPNPQCNDASPHPRFNDGFPLWLCLIIAPGVRGFMSCQKKVSNFCRGLSVKKCLIDSALRAFLGLPGRRRRVEPQGGLRGGRRRRRGAGAPAWAIVGPAAARHRELVAVPALRRPVRVETITARSRDRVSLEPRERGAGGGRARAVCRRPGHARHHPSPG